jgi:lysophospholipase L1-like esterase
VKGGRRQKIGALALGVGLALAGGEALVRALGLISEPREHLDPGPYTADAELGWILRPDYRGVYRGYLFEAATSTNSLGFRGPDWDAARQSAEHRILVLGDSCTFGLGVADAQTFPALLEARLRAQGRKAAVFNAGIPGYDTAQEARLLSRLMAVVRPDLLIVAWLPNDITDDSAEHARLLQVIDGQLISDVAQYRAWRRTIEHHGLKRSALYRFAQTRAKLLRLRSRTRSVPLDRERLRASQESLLEIQRQADALGARTLLVLLPRRPEIAGSNVSLRHHEEMASFAERHGIEVVDLPRLWRGRSAPESIYLPGEQVHLSATGYAEVADAVTATRTLQSR